MIECSKSNLDDVDLVQDFLLKKDLPAQLPDKPNKLYKEQEGVRDIIVVRLYENCHDLITDKYHDEMCPKPKLDVWIQVKKYYPMSTKIIIECKENGIVLTVVVVVVVVVVHFYLETKLYTLEWVIKMCRKLRMLYYIVE